MSKAEVAVDCFEEGFNCSQAVVSAFAPELGLDRETALRVAAAFGGGMGRTGETCGAVSGALMVIGMQLACWIICRINGWGYLIPLQLNRVLKTAFGAWLGFFAIVVARRGDPPMEGGG